MSAPEWVRARRLIREMDKCLDVEPCLLCKAKWHVVTPSIGEPFPDHIEHSENCELGKLFIMAECDGHMILPQPHEF